MNGLELRVISIARSKDRKQVAKDCLYKALEHAETLEIVCGYRFVK